MAAKQRYSPALDGLRGLFMLAFVAYHFGATFLAGMWVAITFFFVLSGFLITRLLTEEYLESGRLRIVEFYRRRARRLLPALFALLAVVTAYGTFAAPTWDRRAIGNDILATLGYVMNWRLIADGDQYFFAQDTPSLLRHAWTLAVEEQFYVIVPFLLLGVFALLLKRRHRVVLLVLAAVALTGWTAHVGFHSLAEHPRAYYGTDMRGSALLVGTALGVALATRADGARVRVRARRARALGWVGLTGLVTMFVLVDPYAAWMWNQGGLLLASALSVALIIGCVDGRGSLLEKVFSWGPLTWGGVRTYGLYLWHWPLALVLDLVGSQRPEIPRWVVFGVGFVLTYVLAAISYRWLERPVIRGGVRGLIPRVRFPLAAGLAPAVALSLVAVQVLVPNPTFADFGTTVTLPDGRTYDPATDASPRPLVPGQPAYRPGQPTRIAMFGDSVPHYLVQRFPRPAYPEVHLTSLTREGCDLLDLPMTLGGLRVVPNEPVCRDLKASWPAQVAADRDEVLVIVASPLLAVPHQMPDGSTAWLDDPRIQQLIIERWSQMVEEATRAGVQQVQILDVPCRDPVPQAIPEEFRAVFAASGKVIDEYRNPLLINGLIRRFVQAHPEVVRIELAAVQCPGGVMERELNGLPVFNDYLHFSPQATPMIWTWLLGQISQNWADRRRGSTS